MYLDSRNVLIRNISKVLFKKNIKLSIYGFEWQI